MNLLNIQILLLIISVFGIMVANSLFNSFIYKKSEFSFEKRDTINSILNYLDVLNYQSVKIDDEENEYVINPEVSLYTLIIGLNKQEFVLIRKIRTIAIENDIVD
jgi:hypothetical protein